MTISEQSRHHLHQKLEEFLGPDEAATLMEHLPPRGWADVATKADLDHQSAITKRDLEALAAVTKHDLDALATTTKSDLDAHVATMKSDLDALAAVTKTDLNALAAATKRDILSLDVKIEAVRNDLGTRIDISGHQAAENLYRELAATTRTVVFACVGAVMTSSGLAFAAARF